MLPAISFLHRPDSFRKKASISFFDVPQAELKTEIPAHGTADDGAGETVAMVNGLCWLHRTTLTALMINVTEPFEVLLTDVVLPGKSGLELAREAVKASPALRIIFSSGFGDVGGDIAGALSIPKPYSMELSHAGIGESKEIVVVSANAIIRIRERPQLAKAVSKREIRDRATNTFFTGPA